MKGMKIVAFAAALAVLPLTEAFARGAGGVTWGEQYFDSRFSNYDVSMNYNGVFGYSVTYGGQRVGGFAMALNTSAGEPELNGGFLGAITGQEFRTGPFLGAVNLWTGFGGLTGGATPGIPGSLALFGELNLEAGFGFMPGVTLTGYAGMQVTSSLSASAPYFTNVMYTPVLGMRVAWGAF